jgi:hypothetical protein
MEVWTELCRVQQIIDASLPRPQHGEAVVRAQAGLPRSAAPSDDDEMDAHPTPTDEKKKEAVSGEDIPHDDLEAQAQPDSSTPDGDELPTDIHTSD